jgi:hypothetical protein
MVRYYYGDSELTSIGEVAFTPDDSDWTPSKSTKQWGTTYTFTSIATGKDCLHDILCGGYNESRRRIIEGID